MIDFISSIWILNLCTAHRNTYISTLNALDCVRPSSSSSSSVSMNLLGQFCECSACIQYLYIRVYVKQLWYKLFSSSQSFAIFFFLYICSVCLVHSIVLYFEMCLPQLTQSAWSHTDLKAECCMPYVALYTDGLREMAMWLFGCAETTNTKEHFI